MYVTSSPILFLVFNRPETTKLVFEEIKKVKPSKIYIAADGPRKDKLDDLEKCDLVKSIVSDIDWECEVEKLFRDENLGCKYAVSSAIDWYFANEEMGIILEDDCLPSVDFFRFCDEMLQYHKNDNRVRFITGSNFQNGNKIGEASYYFSKLSHVWGWATWRRVWKDYDVELERLKNEDTLTIFSNVFQNKIIANDWNVIFNELVLNKINTWDYQLAISNIFNNGLSIIPNANLISNIGIGFDATHTFSSNGFDNLEFSKLDSEIKHPIAYVVSNEADNFTLFREHDVENRSIKRKKTVIERLKFWKK